MRNRALALALAAALALPACDGGREDEIAAREAALAAKESELAAREAELTRVTPEEKAARDRAECNERAIAETGFDPVMAEEPPRTIATTQQAGGKVVGSGDIAKGAVAGAAVGAVGGAIAGDTGTGAAIGAGAGALFGGVRRHRETKKMVTTHSPNPDYTAYVQAKESYKSALQRCLAERQGVAP